MMKKALVKPLLVACGVVSVSLGAIGIFVPLLPTTPFLLLAAACFIRSSEKLYQRLIGNRLFGSYIKNYRDHHAITLRHKIVTIALLWIVMTVSAFTAVRLWWIRASLGVIAVCVTIHLLRLKTLRRTRAIPR